MQPAYVEPLDLSVEAVRERNNNIEEINKEVNDSVDTIRERIFKFKKTVFNDFVSNDSEHDSSDLGAMTNFHAYVLFWISYWISLLDHNAIPKPEFNNSTYTSEFDAITELIKNLLKNPDAKVLIYHMLTKLSSEPLKLGKNENTD